MKFLSVFLLVGSVGAYAQEAPTELAPVRVFGTDKAVLSEPMAPGVVSKDVIESQKITDVNRALKQTPGAYVREEDGQGLRPNIGLRGTNPDRSKKVSLLEDGILIGPAPYSAPAAYYTPNMNRIESLSVYRGFQAVGIGPNSIGGAVDYRTITIPSKSYATEIESSYGSFKTWNSILSHGGITDFGGYLVHGSWFTTDGFKELDSGEDTGFKRGDVLTKLRFDLPSNEGRIHAVELRYGFSNEDSNETYLGLTHDDFDDKPYRRYRASQLDEMVWDHEQYQLKHELQLSSTGLLETSVYRHDFHRTWYRLDRFQDGTRLNSVLRDPTTGVNALRMGILRGEMDSGSGANELVIAGNERTYFSQGVQTKFSGSFDLSETLEVKPWAMLRFHQDEIERNHIADNYEMQSGQMVRTAAATLTDKRNTERANAWTLALGGDFNFDRTLVITPVLRIEDVGYDFKDHLDPTKNNKRHSNINLPGLSTLYLLSETLSGRVSWNKAATIAGLSPDGTEVREEADNYELELKFIDSENMVEALITAFYMDYKNLTGTCSASSGCASANLGEAFDGGEAIVKGVELSAAKGFMWNQFFIPIQANMTLLSAEFDSSFTTSSAEWGSGSGSETVNAGDPLPYVPQVQYSVTLGLEWQKWRQDLTLTYQSKVYDQSVPLNREEIKAYGVVDWTGSYNFSKSGSVFFRAKNLLNKEYAVAARPFGLRPGMPQSFYGGIKYEF